MNKIRVADYIAKRCVEAGASHVFLVTGGGAMHLNDAFGRNKNLTPVCFHHEQAAAMAAAPTIAPQVVEQSAGFDFAQPLNVGLFGGYAQKQKTNQLQPGAAKIATGGYLDDLLNAIR
jgi:hypothetical protein